MTGKVSDAAVGTALSVSVAANKIFLLLTDVALSIHSLYAEADVNVLDPAKHKKISIHSLYAEADDCNNIYDYAKQISIHSLYAEADMLILMTFQGHWKFQSTASTQRLTTTGNWPMT